MKILKSIFAITFFSVIAVSCSKDESPEKPLNPEARKNLLLKWSDANNGLITTYTYNANNQLETYKLNGNAYNSPRDYSFIYNADGTLKQLINALNGSVLQTYTYNSDKKLITKVGGQNVHHYTYNGSEVIDNYRFSVTNTGWREVRTYDAKGNVTEVKTYINASDANPLGTYSEIIKYTYDDKNNAFSSVPFAFIFPGSINNIKSNQYDNGTSEVYMYEYNADNYPVKRTGYDVRTYEYQRL